VTPNRAIAIIDADLDETLKRPGMFVGGTSATDHHSFLLLVLQALYFRASILEAPFDWHTISHRLLVEMTGSGSGNLGPNSRLQEFYGKNSFDPDHPNYGNVMLFYKEFVSRSRKAMDSKE
jgi:hypothetical protein